MFPTLSLLTFLGSIATRLIRNRYVSPVLIPFVGPVLLTCWVLVAEKTYWVIPLVWLLDIGTTIFLLATPRLALDWWRTSSFTRLMTLRGSHGIETVLLTLHHQGRYHLQKSWKRSEGEPGIVGLGETGTFVDVGDSLMLESDQGLTRTLKRVDGNSFDVIETDAAQPELRNDSLHGWHLLG